MSWPCLGWLVANGVITQAQPNRVQPRATDLGVAVDRALVLFGDCTNDDILTAKAEVYGIERVKLDEIEIPDAVIDLIPESVARECSVIPLEQDDEGLVVALSDPGDFDTIERLRFILNTAIVVKLASEEEIRSALDQCYAISTSEPLVLHDLERIKRLPDTLFLGRAFVFVGEAAAEKGWQGDQSVPHSRMVLPRAKGPLQLPGVSVDSATFPKLVLRSITSDKLLYESDRDTVHLLVVAPQWRSTEKTVRLLLNASQSTRHSVNLDVNGCGMLKLQNLPAGEYSVTWPGDASDAATCRFTVAEYQLAQLVADLLEHTMSSSGNAVQVTLRLQSFAQPVHGPVQLELASQGSPVHSVQAFANRGLVHAALNLEGKGPHEIHVWQANDASRTATVQLAGSRLEERSPTPFSKLGPLVSASLIARNDSVETRGLHFRTEESYPTPVELARVDMKVICVLVTRDVEQLHFLLTDAASGDVLSGPVVREKVSAGEIIQLETPSVLSFLAVGAFVEGKPWEGISAIVRPAEGWLAVEAPAVARPGDEAAIDFLVPDDSGASLYVVVKDARLANGDKPPQQLAACIKNAVDAAPISAGFARQTLRDACLEQHRNSRDSALQEFTDTAFNFSGSVDLTSLAMAPAGDMADAPPRSPSEATNTVFADMLTVTDGRARATFSLPDTLTEYVIQACLFSGSDWASAERRFTVTKEAFAELQLPAFLAQGDESVGQLNVVAPGLWRAELRCNGAPVSMVHQGQEYEASRDALGSAATLSFAARPGHYLATLFDADGKVLDQSEGRIDSLGNLRSTIRSIRFLRPGDRVSKQAEPSIVALRLLPSVELPFSRLCEATANYAHCCCEQTAAKVLAACAMYALAGTGSERCKAEHVILLGIQRQQQMWLPGRGFKTYPHCADIPDTCFGCLAARHLSFLDLLNDMSISSALARAVAQGKRMAADAFLAYDMQWPPANAINCGDAYAMVRFGYHPTRRRGLEFIQHLGDQRLDHLTARHHLTGSVARRAETAYRSATLLRGGSPAEFDAALQLANEVVADLGAEGRLYSTFDSVAAIALMSELSARGLIGSNSFFLNGQLRSTSDPLALTEDVYEVAVQEGTLAIEMTTTKEEDWQSDLSTPNSSAVIASLERNGEPSRWLQVGDRLQLVITLPRGYQMGDLAWVCLPPAIARLTGGAQVKRFAVDFAGQDELRLPLVAIAATVTISGQAAVQHIIVRHRNMYEEERCGYPEPIRVIVRS